MIIRKLSYEVDQLLKDIEPEISPVLILNDTEQVDSEDQKICYLIEEEEKALEMRLKSQEKHKSKLSTDLDTLLSQVQNMHTGFTALKQGGHKSPLVHHQLHVECHHERSGSLDMLDQQQTNSFGANSTKQNNLSSRQRVSVVW